MLSRKIKKLKNWLQNRKNLQLFRLQLAEDKQKTAAYRVVLVSHELSATGAPVDAFVCCGSNFGRWRTGAGAVLSGWAAASGI